MADQIDLLKAAHRDIDRALAEAERATVRKLIAALNAKNYFGDQYIELAADLAGIRDWK